MIFARSTPGGKYGSSSGEVVEGSLRSDRGVDRSTPDSRSARIRLCPSCGWTDSTRSTTRWGLPLASLRHSASTLHTTAASTPGVPSPARSRRFTSALSMMGLLLDVRAAGGVEEVDGGDVGRVDVELARVREDARQGSRLGVRHLDVGGRPGGEVEGEEQRAEGGVGPVVVLPGLVVDLAAAPDQAQQFGFELRVVAEDEPAAVAGRPPRLVDLRRRELRDGVAD